MQAIMSDINAAGYVGIPDFLKIIIEKAEKNNFSISQLKKALFSGGPLFLKLLIFSNLKRSIFINVMVLLILA